MAGKLYKPSRARSLWTLVRRLLCRKSCRSVDAATAAEKDGEKNNLLASRSSLEELLVSEYSSDGGGASECGEKDDGRRQLVAPGILHRPVARPDGPATSSGGGAAEQYRRFMFGGFRRRLLMRRPWRPMLVAIPEWSIDECTSV